MSQHDSPGRVVIMGLGRFGGGLGAARYFARRGAAVLVTDLNPPDRLQASIEQLGDWPNLELRLGEHREADFTSAELVVVNPAIAPGANPYLDAARRAGARITSEIRLLTGQLPERRRVIGVTGTAGKSTVTAMIGHILRHEGVPVWIGGNIGGSLLESLDQIRPEHWIVLELSSFMLTGLHEDGFSPHIAVVTNVAPNHLDWHGDFERYKAAKQHILDHQEADDWAILGPGALPHVQLRAGRAIHETASNPDDLPGLELLIPGRHNRENAALAIDALLPLDIPPHRAAQALGSFPGLAHRLQFVCEYEGVRYFNDSKSTTPEAARLAIDSFEPGQVHLIAGGYDKHSDLGELGREVARRCRALYAIGQTAEALTDAADPEPDFAAIHGPSSRYASCGAAGWSQGDARGAQVFRCRTLDRAVAEAHRRARPGQVVLLSPACASWDQFDNYEQRGERFVELVRQLCEG